MNSVFFDTSVLLAGLIETGPPGEAAQTVMGAVASGKLREPMTAWHCCLEFYSVATRLPPDLRLAPADALRLMEEEILVRFTVHQLPARDRLPLLRAVAQERLAGGRIYDVHIAEVARSARAEVVVTENRRHFVSLLRYGIGVVTSRELVERLGLG